MSRLIFCPQFPENLLRYQEFWFTEFRKQFKKHFDEVITLGENVVTGMEQGKDHEMFSPIGNAIYFEQSQIIEFLNLELRADDIFFLSDLSFPGFFTNILYHKPLKNCYTYLHATSKNNYDYFSPVRHSKYPCEVAHSKLFKKVFVGSEYHKRKLGWKNLEVIGLPIPPFQTFKEDKKYDIISVSRPSIQKVNKKLEKEVVRDFGEIKRKNTNSWEQYYKFLSQAKIVLLSGKEETFGYQVLEAIMNCSTPLAPKNFSYPELLSDEYLYSNYEELRVKICQVLNGTLLSPKKLLCHDLCENFYENIVKEMNGD